MAVLENPPLSELQRFGELPVFQSWLVRLRGVVLKLAQGNGYSLGGADKAVITDSAGSLAVSATTATELGYLSGISSAVQTQLNAKAPSVNPSFDRVTVTERGVKLPVLTAEPTSPQNGEIVCADGTSWNPGGGAGFYGRSGGSWVKF